jgi:hypothetical protein
MGVAVVPPCGSYYPILSTKKNNHNDVFLTTVLHSAAADDAFSFSEVYKYAD